MKKHLITFLIVFSASALGSIYALHFFPCVAHYSVQGYVDFNQGK